MRRFYATILLFALVLLQLPPAQADTEPRDRSPSAASEPTPAPSHPQEPVSDSDGSVHAAGDPAGPVAERVPLPPLSRDEICRMIERAAAEEALPPEFLARLIWQESRFDPQAVSPVGAQGIAQFMPRTANGRGLANPFDALPALFESAEYLAELRRQFGNLGLAAAAYNAGPKRLQDWLARRGGVSAETRNYVQLITGHPLEAWAAAEPPSAQDIAAEDFRCPETPKLAAQRYRRLLAEIVRRVRAEQAAKAEAEKKAAKLAAAEARKARGARLADRSGSKRNEARAQANGKPAKRSAVAIVADRASRGGRRGEARHGSSGRSKVAVSQRGPLNLKPGARRLRVAQASGDKRCSAARGRKSCREA
jgi:hypothetical protein